MSSDEPSRAKGSEPIVLNIKDVLIAARKAFDAGELAIQTGRPRTTYAGPCAVGAAIPPERRKALDKNYPRICSLVMRGVVQTDDEPGLTRLQRAHDNAYDPAEFEQALVALEAEHALAKARPASEPSTGRLVTPKPPTPEDAL